MNAALTQNNTGLLTTFCNNKCVSYSWLVILACKVQLFYAVLACCQVSPDCTIFFSHYLINSTIFKKELVNTKCDFSLQLVWNKNQFKKHSMTYNQKYIKVFTCEASVKLLRFSWNLNFLNRFYKNTKISNFMNIRSVGVELFYADR